MDKNKRPDYGNWVSRNTSMVLIIGALLLILISSLLHSFSRIMFINVIFDIITFLAIVYVIYMHILKFYFSFNHGGVMGKIHDFVITKVDLTDKKTVLDIGCGAGPLSIKIAKQNPNVQVTGIDYWGIVWNYGKEQCEANAKIEGVQNVQFQQGDARKLDFEDESFDCVVSNFVFHEVRPLKDKTTLITEALRVLKPGGVFVFHDLFEHKKTYPDMDAFIQKLKDEGITEIHYDKNTEREDFIPAIARTPLMLYNLGIIYGVK